MERISQILQDNLYREYIQKIEILEIDRKFCRHDISHFLDVCRIAYILNLEQSLGLSKELIYAAGLLHDIGRWCQYESGEDHAVASERLCEEILIKYQFTLEDINQIKEAIRNHRKIMSGSDLSQIIYKADKLSRNCMFCKAIGECKNITINEEIILEY